MTLGRSGEAVPLDLAGPYGGETVVTPDMEQILLGRLTEVAQQQASAAAQQAVTAERMVGLIERMNDGIARAEVERTHQHELTRYHMDGVGKSIAGAVALDAAARDSWWRKMLAVIAVIQIINVIVNFIKK